MSLSRDDMTVQDDGFVRWALARRYADGALRQCHQVLTAAIVEA